MYINRVRDEEEDHKSSSTKRSNRYIASLIQTTDSVRVKVEPCRTRDDTYFSNQGKAGRCHLSAACLRSSLCPSIPLRYEGWIQPTSDRANFTKVVVEALPHQQKPSRVKKM
ncbi:hypothetical protein K1719_009769 [Acacia pycnantha]|nr:hypothetical protein K1719_009769 [Acacia pycnantha]